ncbi:MAG: DUF2807 domain-containing protein [Rhizomicrobium sp.]
MRNKTSSMLIGAAVAALLVLPAAAGDPGWVTWPTKSFPTTALRVEDIIGNVRVNVQNGPMKVDVSGPKNLISGVSVRADGNVLRISGNETDSYNVWDWRSWFDFSHIHDDHSGKLYIKVTVPKGGDVRVEDMIGDTTVGDTYGVIRLETTAGNATVGRVREAHVMMAGSGKTSIADVAGDLRLEIAGSGHVTASHAGSVRAEIYGSGDAQVGSITGGVHIEIAGSGDFTAARVNGPVSIDIAGSGNVKIADGVADPLRVDIAGAGDLYFGGVAVNPSISALGSGNVHIKAYRGKLSNDGMASVMIGDRIPPVPPMPPVPGIPPVPPVPGHAAQPPAPPAHHSDDDDDDN